jgi:hypothetical protein
MALGNAQDEEKNMTTAATSPIVTSKLLSRHEVAEGTIAFRFERPSNSVFKAGQYLDMTLLDLALTDALIRSDPAPKTAERIHSQMNATEEVLCCAGLITTNVR